MNWRNIFVDLAIVAVLLFLALSFIGCTTPCDPPGNCTKTVYTTAIIVGPTAFSTTAVRKASVPAEGP